MTQSLSSSNPFALLLNPEAVLSEIARSERLNRLQSRVFRPLDKPLIPKVEGDAARVMETEAADSDGDDERA